MNPETNTSIQAFFMILVEQFILVIVPILLTLLGALLNEGRKFVKRHASAEKITILEGIIRTVVAAAEKAGLNREIAKEGSAKKQYAIELAQSILNERGLTNISVATISAYIEAALQQGYEQGLLLATEGGPLAEIEVEVPVYDAQDGPHLDTELSPDDRSAAWRDSSR